MPFIRRTIGTMLGSRLTDTTRDVSEIAPTMLNAYIWILNGMRLQENLAEGRGSWPEFIVRWDSLTSLTNVSR